MKELKNTFSWSKSRDDTFRFCKRKYYFEKYGFWGGWEKNTSERVRKIYILKNLTSRQIWIGRAVHDIIKHLLLQQKDKRPISLSFLLKTLRKKLDEEFSSSKNKLYIQYPKKVGLIEHEFNFLISKDEWDDLFNRAENCVTNFFNSDTFRYIKRVGPSNWVFLEDFLYFDFEGTKVFLSIDFAVKERNKIILYDWKTGQERDTDMDMQLACYALYVMQKWDIRPENIITKRYNVALDKEDVFTINEEIIEKTKNFMRQSIAEMKELLIDKENNIAREKDFEMTEHENKCKTCNFNIVCPKQN